MHGFDRSTNLILLKIDIQVRYPMIPEHLQECLKDVWFRNSNYKLHIYATYDFLQIALCAQF